MAFVRSSAARIGSGIVKLDVMVTMIREQHPGISQALAETMAADGLSHRIDRLSVARRWGLLKVDTTAARAAGLIL